MMELRRKLKRSMLAVWAGGLGVGVYAGWNAGVSAAELPELLIHWFHAHGAWGPVTYILAYAVRPVTLIPATFLTVASGVLFGPLGGILYTIVGENLSAAVGFGMARWLGQEWFTGVGGELIVRLERHMESHGLLTVVSLRLLYLPFDVVNFACGLTRMRFSDYAYGTFLGVLPGIVSFVYVGAAWWEPRNLLIAAAFFLLSLGLARAIRREEPVAALSEDLKK